MGKVEEKKKEESKKEKDTRPITIKQVKYMAYLINLLVDIPLNKRARKEFEKMVDDILEIGGIEKLLLTQARKYISRMVELEEECDREYNSGQLDLNVMFYDEEEEKENKVVDLNTYKRRKEREL